MKAAYSVAMSGDVHRSLANHLVRKDRQEDLCFATYSPSQGTNRFSGLISFVILPEDGERAVHGNVSFSAAYFERALSISRSRGEGLVFLHSHPFPGWQFMSSDDIKAETRLSIGAMAVTGLPLLGLTIGSDQTWSARFWLKHSSKRRTYVMERCHSVRIAGERLSVSYPPEKSKHTLNHELLLRTISAWGENSQKDLSQLTVGIVGLGSVGSMVAEILARKGFTNFVLIDFDRVEAKNLDRLMNVYYADIGKLKISAISKGMRRSKTARSISIREVPYSVCEENGFRAALDCDVLFSCVDRPWPRQVLNVIAYAHLIPVIDGGIKVLTNKDNTVMKGADWKVQTVGPGRPCLEQWGQYTSALATLERNGSLDDPDYIDGMEDKSVVEAKENVFAFSANLASLEVLQLISLVIAPSGISSLGQQTYHMKNGTMDIVRGNPFGEESFCQRLTAKGENTGFVIYAPHFIAEQARNAG
jgi:hypothetical protein